MRTNAPRDPRIDALILSWRQSSSLDVQQLLDELEAILGKESGGTGRTL